MTTAAEMLRVPLDDPEAALEALYRLTVLDGGGPEAAPVDASDRGSGSGSASTGVGGGAARAQTPPRSRPLPRGLTCSPVAVDGNGGGAGVGGGGSGGTLANTLRRSRASLGGTPQHTHGAAPARAPTRESVASLATMETGRVSVSTRWSIGSKPPSRMPARDLLLMDGRPQPMFNPSRRSSSASLSSRCDSAESTDVEWLVDDVAEFKVATLHSLQVPLAKRRSATTQDGALARLCGAMPQ